MSKKYNNESNDCRDWTNAKLKKEAKYYHEIIYGDVCCYGRNDMFVLSAIVKELDNRGISISTKLSFN